MISKEKIDSVFKEYSRQLLAKASKVTRNRTDAEDIVSSTWIEFLAENAKGNVKEESKMLYFLYTMLHRVTYDYLERKHREREILEIYLEKQHDRQDQDSVSDMQGHGLSEA